MHCNNERLNKELKGSIVTRKFENSFNYKSLIITANIDHFPSIVSEINLTEMLICMTVTFCNRLALFPDACRPFLKDFTGISR